MRRSWVGWTGALAAMLSGVPAGAQPEGDVAGQGQPEVVRPLTPIPPERLEQMVPKHPDYLGALAPENLARPRPAAPFDERVIALRRWRSRPDRHNLGPPLSPEAGCPDAAGAFG